MLAWMAVAWANEALAGEAVDAVLASMTLEQKVSQMMMSSPPLAKEGPVDVGGIIILGYLLKGEETVRSRVADLQARATVPLLVAADVEGGDMNRLGFVEGLEVIPSARELGEGSPEGAKQVGQTVGRGMLSIGLNTNLAPVLDLADKGMMHESGRSMGAEPDQVAAVARAYSDGLWAAGVVPIGKHFPGYGDLEQNSDHHLVVTDRSSDEIARHADAFVQVGDKVAGVMLANVGYSAYGSVPAILSSELVQMAHDYGWLTITDDLAIEALAESVGGDREEVVRRAFLAGNDVLLTTAPIDWDQALDYRGIVLELVKGQPELEAQVDESVRRILQVKARAGLLGD